MEIPTSLLKNNLPASQGLDNLTIFENVLFESVFDKMVNDDALCKFWNAEGIETPIDGMPPLESVICRYENCIFFS